MVTHSLTISGPGAGNLTVDGNAPVNDTRVRHRHRAGRLHVGNDLRSHDHGWPRQGHGRGRDLREQRRHPHVGRRRHHRQSIDDPHERLVRRRRSLRQQRDGERVQQHDHQQHDHVQRRHYARRRQQWQRWRWHLLQRRRRHGRWQRRKPQHRGDGVELRRQRRRWHLLQWRRGRCRTSTVVDNSVHITSTPAATTAAAGSTQTVAALPSAPATIDGNSFTLDRGTGGDYGGGGVYESGGGVTVAFSTIDGNSLTMGRRHRRRRRRRRCVSQGDSIGVGFSSISNNTTNISDSGGDEVAVRSWTRAARQRLSDQHVLRKRGDDLGRPAPTTAAAPSSASATRRSAISRSRTTAATSRRRDLNRGGPV